MILRLPIKALYTLALPLTYRLLSDIKRHVSAKFTSWAKLRNKEAEPQWLTDNAVT
jgi:hypothetical protein